jgi:hypothetical protein
VPSDIVAVTVKVSVPWILIMSVDGLIATDTVVADGVGVVGVDDEPPPPHADRPIPARTSRA